MRPSRYGARRQMRINSLTAHKTIITTAVPTIAEHFQSATGYTWIGSAYLLGAASSTPLWGKISDIFGRKPILLIANLVFFVGSLLAATSVSIGMLIAARAIQGCGGGGLIVLVNISIGDLFSMRYVFISPSPLPSRLRTILYFHFTPFLYFLFICTFPKSL
jgi:MFS family permease